MSEQNPRVEHLLENINLRDTLIALKYIDSSDTLSRNMVCPFHGMGEERRPSARAYEESDDCPSGMFHCFACNRSWNPIQFLAEFKAIPFWEAVRWLEAKFRVTPPTITEIVQGITQEEKPQVTPAAKELHTTANLEKKLDLVDMLLRQHKLSFQVKEFRALSDASDLLRVQARKGVTEAGSQIEVFLTKLKRRVRGA